jgi:acetolactate synthase-1/2/3 large subunit
MNVGEKLAQLLAQSGVKYVFGVPGGQTLPLYEGIRKLDGTIRHILMRDERSAGFAADAHARLTGCIGVCDATVGPGATNLLSPLAEAYCSSIPLLAVISDVPRHWEHRRIRGNASQAMEQLAMFGPVSKWQVTLSEPGSLENVFDQAVRVAISGRPGPVVLAVPDDVAGLPVAPSNILRNRLDGTFPRHRTAPDPEQVARAVDAMKKSHKPILLVGGGAHASGAGSEVAALAHRLQAPVVTSISGKGILAENGLPAFGVTGSMASPAANDMVTRADLVFFIGCKAGQLATYGYDRPGPDTVVIHLDIDPEEIGRNFPQTIGLVADVRLGLRAVIEALGSQEMRNQWDLQAAGARLKQWYDQATGIPQPSDAPLKPQAIMGVMDALLTRDDIVVCDASLASGWAAVYLRLKQAGRGYLAPRGLAGLGWGAPAAIGAALARPGQRILHFAGDGGFAYSVQELEVMARLNLPIVTILFNNDCLGWIKHIQKTRYQERYISCDFHHIDFATVARGFDVRSYHAATLGQVAEAMAAEQAPDGPVLIDMRTDQWETPVLRNASGGTTAS